MPYELRENSGNAFKNNFKEAEDSKPDFTGEHLNADGKVERMAIWLKKTSKGDRFLGYVISEKQESQQKPEVNRSGGFDETDIPF
jgi:hypothetical protein|tara:strand:+ start:3124 stop:3378 length:255 start_codon:yes stop_codon:yes gene_type:complete